MALFNVCKRNDLPLFSFLVREGLGEAKFEFSIGRMNDQKEFLIKGLREYVSQTSACFRFKLLNFILRHFSPI